MRVSATELVKEELIRTSNRILPDDPLRRVALVCEESGEALKAALDLTRRTYDHTSFDATIIEERRRQIKLELTQTAAMALRVLNAMLLEEGQ